MTLPVSGTEPTVCSMPGRKFQFKVMGRSSSPLPFFSVIEVRREKLSLVVSYSNSYFLYILLLSLVVIYFRRFSIAQEVLPR